MATSTVDLSAGLVPKQADSGGVDLSAGLVPRGAAPAPNPNAQLPNAGVGAAPVRDATSYMQDVQSDLLHGGNRTVIGKGLGYLQGRSDQGASGLESGASPEQAQFMGSVPLGVSKMAQGVTELGSHPVTGAGHILSGALQTATLPGSFVAPEASEVAGQAGSAIASKVLPSAIKERAAGLLQSVAHDANSVPVQLNNAGDAALSLMDWQKKTTLGPTVNKFLNRITNPKAGPLTYEEGRDFYQLLGRLSVDETNKMAPPVRRVLTQMVSGLKQDIGDAADTVGRAADYYKGMGDYAKGAKYQDWYDTAKNALTNELAKGVIKGAGAGAGGSIVYELYKHMKE